MIHPTSLSTAPSSGDSNGDSAVFNFNALAFINAGTKVFYRRAGPKAPLCEKGVVTTCHSSGDGKQPHVILDACQRSNIGLYCSPQGSAAAARGPYGGCCGDEEAGTAGKNANFHKSMESWAKSCFGDAFFPNGCCYDNCFRMHDTTRSMQPLSSMLTPSPLPQPQPQAPQHRQLQSPELPERHPQRPPRSRPSRKRSALPDYLRHKLTWLLDSYNDRQDTANVRLKEDLESLPAMPELAHESSPPSPHGSKPPTKWRCSKKGKVAPLHQRQHPAESSEQHERGDNIDDEDDIACLLRRVGERYGLCPKCSNAPLPPKKHELDHPSRNPSRSPVNKALNIPSSAGNKDRKGNRGHGCDEVSLDATGADTFLRLAEGALVQAMRSQPSSPSVQVHACVALSKIAPHWATAGAEAGAGPEAARWHFKECGGLKAVRDVLRNFPKEEETTRYEMN